MAPTLSPPSPGPRLLATLLIALAAALPAAPTAQAAPEWEGITPVPVLSGLPGPIDFAIADDGSLWWNEYYTGNVSRARPGESVRTTMFHADPIPNGVERGLIGLALDPAVSRTGVFYVFYTVADPNDPDGGTNRFSRIQNGTEKILFTSPAAKMHDGGRIILARDGSLFVSVGDHVDVSRSQDLKSYLGKILHLWPDGRAAAGNIEGYIYDLGHRNVYGFAYDPYTNRLFGTENSNAERDEVNQIEAGKNYGWPACEGNVYFDEATGSDTDRPCDDPKYTLPIGEFYPDTTAAPTGAAMFRGDLYWASWNEGSIHRMVQDAATKKWTDTVVYRPGGRINDMEATADGKSIYYSNWTHILRLDIPGTWTPPPLPTITSEPSQAPSSTPPTTGSSGTSAPSALLAGVAALVALLVRARREL